MFKIKTVIKTFRITSRHFKIFIYFFLGLFLVFNIVASQMVSPIYFSLVNGDREATTSYLIKISPLPLFETELKKGKVLFGNEIEDDVFRKEIEQNNRIKNLEQSIERNPYSRDILYSLYLLYDSRGDKAMAEKYLQRVREIDPGFF